MMRPSATARSANRPQGLRLGIMRLGAGGLAAGLATLVLGTALAPRAALAQAYGYDDGRCSRDTATGAVVGGALGATAGASVSGHGSKTGGAVVGGLLGAAVGAGVGGHTGCDRGPPVGYAGYAGYQGEPGYAPSDPRGYPPEPYADDGAPPQEAYGARGYDGYPPAPSPYDAPAYDDQRADGYRGAPSPYDAPPQAYGYGEQPAPYGYDQPQGDPRGAYGGASAQSYGDQRDDEGRFYQPQPDPGGATQQDDGGYPQTPSPYAGYRP